MAKAKSKVKAPKNAESVAVEQPNVVPSVPETPVRKSVRRLPTSPRVGFSYAPSKYRKDKPVLTKTHVGEAIRKGLLKATNTKVLAQLDVDETELAKAMADSLKWHEHEAFNIVRDPFTSPQTPKPSNEDDE